MRRALAVGLALLGAGATQAAPGDRVNWRFLDLNRSAKRLSPKQVLAMGSAEQSSGPERARLGFAWNRGDQRTDDWYPQGITGLPARQLLVSWYHKGEGDKNKGARVSFIDASDMGRVRYRHVLLVEPDPGPAGFRVVRSHAGGLARCGDWLFVMNSDEGVRAFHLADLYEAALDPAKRKLGVIDGVPFALNYRYYLLQRAFWKRDDLGGPRFSWASTDYSGDAEGPATRLVTGNYHSDHSSKYSNAPPAMAWWAVGEDGGLTRTADTLTDSGILLRERAQGGVYRDGVIWLATSGAEARLWVARDPARRSQDYVWYPWAHGTEDLHLSRTSGNLWSLTEHPGRRMVFAVDVARYGPPEAGRRPSVARHVLPVEAGDGEVLGQGSAGRRRGR